MKTACSLPSPAVSTSTCTSSYREEDVFVHKTWWQKFQPTRQLLDNQNFTRAQHKVCFIKVYNKFGHRYALCTKIFTDVSFPFQKRQHNDSGCIYRTQRLSPKWHSLTGSMLGLYKFDQGIIPESSAPQTCLLYVHPYVQLCGIKVAAWDTM